MLENSSASRGPNDRPRGANHYALTERRCDTYSAVLRSFDELLRLGKAGLQVPHSPVLFSVYLDTSKVTVGKTVVFSVELAVSTTGYTIDQKLWLDPPQKGFKARLRLEVQRVEPDPGA